MLRIESIPAVQEAVLAAGRVHPRGGGTKRVVHAAAPEVTVLDMRGLAGMVEMHPESSSSRLWQGRPWLRSRSNT